MHQKFLQTKVQLQTTVRQLQMVDVEKKKAAQSSHMSCRRESTWPPLRSRTSNG